MFSERMREDLTERFEQLEADGMFKHERLITTAQGPEISTERSGRVLNFCANNYLGLSNDPRVIAAAGSAMERWGYGLSSVRFICGTQQLHRDLEQRISSFLGTEDTILYAACFDANGGLFEPLLGPEDALISDELNHASIIDGVRLCKADRYRYRHSDMEDLERCLQSSSSARYRLIATDGVFSMDGDIADLQGICDLAERYDALVMVDDSHASGVIGNSGRGTAEYCGTEGRVDLITTTFGKALGGASGGCTSGRKELIGLLRQRSRPYLFSNTLPPAVAGATLEVLNILETSTDRLEALRSSARYFKERISQMGYTIVPGDTPIVPVMLKDERTALELAERLLAEGIYVIGFVYPVVPRGKARIRIQISAAHTREQLDRALDAFERQGRKMGLISPAG